MFMPKIDEFNKKVSDLASTAGKKVSEAAQTAAKKSSDFMEISKLNKSISNEEETIQKLMTELGRELYEKYLKDELCDGSLKETCSWIKIHEQNIEEYKQKINEFKNIKTCPNCGEKFDTDVEFCTKCGSKLE
ncbi:MAG TPA: zinc-ribbon domain-containing protein [Clostridiaceae bacterium]|nr:zinc-ribbon domain-containing protein [Clostridiaceae bacterium]HBN28195.1 zinc-ribbon domain-containing protein [Clostridiaceae bacterium]HBX47911.1 zinc-ribbon domain-containing protein [Clostridiaceae bacterium]HCL50543.1 zinc-ribbon domain-containing protein [Clostridiaceae bacterium]